MLRYSVGYLFTDTFKTVLVIDKPNKGLLNGLGGKMKDDETPQAAMQREFAEETLGADCDPVWHHFVTLVGTDDKGRPFECNFFYASIPTAQMSSTFSNRVIHNSEGDVYPESVDEILAGRFPTMSNMSWLMHMAISVATKKDTCTLFHIKEIDYHDNVQLRSVEKCA
jgi:8-oxo-dGTP pyrophosphatase MutT (NUDIX family)